MKIKNWLALGLFIWGMGFALSSLYFWVNTNPTLSGKDQTTGKVIRKIGKKGCPVVEYQHLEVARQFRSKECGLGTPDLGEEVTVLYDPKDAKSGFIARDSPINLFLFLMIMGFGGIFFAFKIKNHKKERVRRGRGELLFSQEGASGRSHKSLITKLGGANRILIVEVDSEGLHTSFIYPFSLLSGLMKQYDLEHSIPFSNLRSLELKKGLLGPSVFIDFENSHGESKKLELRLSEPQKLIEVLQQRMSA